MDDSGTDDYDHDESDSAKSMSKKYAHTAAEQKRRDAIKRGVEKLQGLVPGCGHSEVRDGLVMKTSKAQVLQKTIEFIQSAQSDRDKKLSEIEELGRKLTALRIMEENYERLVKSNESKSAPSQEVADEIKFDVFKHVADTLWESFSTRVTTKSFETVSACMISWLEECCKPEHMRSAAIRAIRIVLGG